MKPLSIVVEYNRTVREADELQRAANQMVSAIERVYAQVGSHVNEIATLADRHGMKALLAELPAELVPVVQGVVGALAASWAALSDEPFPAMPDEAVPVAEPEPEPESVEEQP